jgi:hypothetical protein
MNAVNEFLDGGTKLERLGYLFGRSFYLFTKITVIALVIFLIVLLAQVKQYAVSLNHFRQIEMTNWANDDIQKQNMVADFKKYCLIGKSLSPETDAIKRPITISECAVENGYSELMAVIDNADSKILLASPVNWF